MAETASSHTAATELLARLVGQTPPPPAPLMYGIGTSLSIGSTLEDRSERLLQTALSEYLDRNPLERRRLTNDLRGMTTVPPNFPVYSTGIGMLPNYYSQGSFPLTTHIGAAGDTDRDFHYCSFAKLDQYRSDVASLARFAQRVEHASIYIFVAIDGQVEKANWRKTVIRQAKPARSWFGEFARQSFSRWKCTRELLSTPWSITEPTEDLYRTAFWSLCELTPADTQLKSLFEQDRFRACRELVKHVDIYADQLALATRLAEEMAKEVDGAVKSADAEHLEALQRNLLEKAGESLTLTKAAERLGMSRQALHKRLKSGGALGLMIGNAFVVPAIQLVEAGGETTVVAHLKDVLSLFTSSGAGSWSALQYLIEPDPVLHGAAPLDRLKQGEVKAVVASARAYLGLDEG